jgi:RHS repeat-associated protein
LTSDARSGTLGATDVARRRRVQDAPEAGARRDTASDRLKQTDYRARYYDPARSRFVGEDPIGFDGSANFYQYAGNAPLNHADPLGLFWDGWVNPVPWWPGALRGAGDLYRNYRDMRQAGWKGADKYFHCKGNCEAAQRGRGGLDIACLIGDVKEWHDQTAKGYPSSDSDADQAANQYGRTQGLGNPGAPCSVLCAPYRPAGLPSQY